MRPMGRVRAGRDDPANTDHWGDVESTIVLEERFGDECLAGLTDFSHVDYREPRSSRTRRPTQVGVFCDRGPRRLNRIGVTSCRIRAVDGRELRVQGLDAVVGTPVIDLKPVMREFLARDVRQPAWVGALRGEYFQP